MHLFMPLLQVCIALASTPMGQSAPGVREDWKGPVCVGAGDLDCEASSPRPPPFISSSLLWFPPPPSAPGS